MKFASMLWAIEQCFEETKGEGGMAQYEVRKYAVVRGRKIWERKYTILKELSWSE